MYSVDYYHQSWNDHAPAKDYLRSLSKSERLKIGSYITLLAENDGYLEEPRSKKVTRTKFRELIVDCGNLGYRIFYFTTRGQRIILLHSFQKKGRKTPQHEIERGKANYKDFIDSEGS